VAVAAAAGPAAPPPAARRPGRRAAAAAVAAAAAAQRPPRARRLGPAAPHPLALLRQALPAAQRHQDPARHTRGSLLAFVGGVAAGGGEATAKQLARYAKWRAAVRAVGGRGSKLWGRAEGAVRVAPQIAAGAAGALTAPPAATPPLAHTPAPPPPPTRRRRLR
jgi:hypothetical protein